MGSQHETPRQKVGLENYRLLQVVVVRNSAGKEIVSEQVLCIDNRYDTLQAVQENLAEIIDNVVRAKVLVPSGAK